VKDPYRVLGVSRTASEAEIKKAFRRLARELHPDVNKHDPAAEERFKEAAAAYEVLSDPQRRAIYDRFGEDGLRSGGFEPTFTDLSDILDAFFGSGEAFGSIFGGGARRRRGPARGEDAAVELELTLEEVAHGATKDIELDVLVPCDSCGGSGAEPGTSVATCPQCGGSGHVQTAARTAFGQVVRTHPCRRCDGEGRIVERPCAACDGHGRRYEPRRLAVDVPPGIGDGQRIRLSGRGHAGSRGGPNGDLYVLAAVSPDPRFERRGSDLVTRLDVPFTEAALGATMEVPTLNGDRPLELEPGTQPGTVIRLRGEGVPALGGRRRGDLHVVINVLVPRNLTEEQRDMLERFARSANGRNYPSPRDGGGFFERIRQAFRA
jgi:molecular chaperone DnaJ